MLKLAWKRATWPTGGFEIFVTFVTLLWPQLKLYNYRLSTFIVISRHVTFASSLGQNWALPRCLTAASHRQRTYRKRQMSMSHSSYFDLTCDVIGDIEVNTTSFRSTTLSGLSHVSCILKADPVVSEVDFKESTVSSVMGKYPSQIYKFVNYFVLHRKVILCFAFVKI